MPTLPLTDCVIRPSPSISLNLSFFLTYFFFFWLCSMACGILVPQLRIEPVSPALEAQSLNWWTAMGVP